jgi:chromosome segregation ATPase
MPELTLEKVMSDLQSQIKAKKLELETIGKEINSLLDEKLSLVNSINATRQKLTEFSDEKKELETDNRTVKIFIKDQRDELNKDKIALISAQDKFKTEQTKIETENKKAQDSIKNKEESLARDRQAAKETEQKAKDEAKKSQELQILLNAEISKTEKLQKEYETKTKESKAKQDEAIINLDKSKEIKAVLDSKIIETDNLKNQYENLIKANEAKTISLDKQIEENKKVAEELEVKNKSFIQKETSLVNRQIELNEREKQLDHKELRILKLAKDKGIQEEIKKWEEELGIKK